MNQIQMDNVPGRIEECDEYIYIEIDDVSANHSLIIGWLLVTELLNEDRDVPVKIGDKDTIPLTCQQVANGEIDKMLQ